LYFRILFILFILSKRSFGCGSLRCVLSLLLFKIPVLGVRANRSDISFAGLKLQPIALQVVNAMLAA